MDVKYDLIFISTCQDHELAHQLVASINRHNQQLQVHLVMINQTGNLILEETGFLSCSVVNTKESMSLSRARNLAMSKIREWKLEATFVFYPDDDTTFDDVFFRDFKKYVTDQEQAYLIRVLNEDDHREYKNFSVADGQILKRKHATLAISYNMIIPFSLFRKVGAFDEKLGVGARYGSSEDLDYFIRCQQLQPFIFIKNLHCFHPSRDGKYRQMNMSQIKKRFEKYSEGYLFVMFRYGFWAKILSLPFRSLGGAALNVLRLKFNWAWAYIGLFFKRWFMILRFLGKKIAQPEAFRFHGKI